jgi:hypothetical protein
LEREEQVIIQIRGTSGSGKTTVMRKVMEAGGLEPVYVPSRKRPLYYEGRIAGAKVAVLGHYDSPCGGCDTIGSARAVYDLIQKVKSPVILCEGLLLSEDVKWSSQLPDLRVLYLLTPLEQCIRQIEGRRKAAGNDKPLNVENTSRRVAVIERSRIKLLERGIVCQRSYTRQASEIILGWIRKSHE